jgi:hypothetical protein
MSCANRAILRVFFFFAFAGAGSWSADALIGKKKGAAVEVMAPGGAKAYEITKVEWR